MSNASDTASILQMLNEEKRIMDIPTLIYLGIAMAIGSVGNALVCYIYYFKLKVTASNLFLVMLSFSDFLGSLLCVPLDLMIVLYPYTFTSDAGCRICHFFIVNDVIVLVLVVFAVSVDRLRKVLRPLHDHLTHGQVGYICGAIVILGTLLSTPCFYIYAAGPVTTHRLNMIGMQCTYSTDDKARKIYEFSLIGMFILVLVSLCVIYIIVGTQLRRVQAEIRPLDDEGQQGPAAVDDFYIDQPEESELSFGVGGPGVPTETINRNDDGQRHLSKHMNMRQTTFLLFMINLTWLITFLPFLVASCLPLTTQEKESPLYQIGIRSFYFYNVLNPFIYTIFNFRFREEAISLLQKAKCC